MSRGPRRLDHAAVSNPPSFLRSEGKGGRERGGRVEREGREGMGREGKEERKDGKRGEEGKGLL